jgi:tetratricopeptide (TPR) repeat protein
VLPARLALTALRTALLTAWVLAALSGCGAGGAPIVTRRVAGEARAGIFVSPFSYEHFIRGELAELGGDLRQAAEAYELARAGPEDDPLLLARLADVTDRLGREAQALALLEHGEALDPTAEIVWLTRGRIHERHQRRDEAIEAYSRAAALAPRSEQGPLALAALLRAQGELEEADAVLARYLERARGAGAARARLRLAIENRQPQAAADAVRALLEVAPARADEVREAAVTALDGGQPELALRLLAAVPEREEERALRLRAALAAGDRGRAEAVLATWMPRGPEALLEVACGYLEVGMPARAVELARVALSAGAGAEARLVLGRALRGAGRLDEAAQVLASIERGSAAWPEGPIELARTLRVAGRPGLAAEVLARAGEGLSVRLALAEARREAGDAEGALSALSAGEPAVRAARAQLLDALGRVDEAAEAYATLPLDHPVADERARAEAALRSGDRAGAIERLREHAGRAPEDLLGRARLAELLAAAGEWDEARRVAAEVLPLASDPRLRARLLALVAEPS